MLFFEKISLKSWRHFHSFVDESNLVASWFVLTPTFVPTPTVQAEKTRPVPTIWSKFHGVISYLSTENFLWGAGKNFWKIPLKSEKIRRNLEKSTKITQKRPFSRIFAKNPKIFAPPGGEAKANFKLDHIFQKWVMICFSFVEPILIWIARIELFWCCFDMSLSFYRSLF